jgi:AraC family transcriptional regulator, arabinose operon regulatory protein
LQRSCHHAFGDGVAALHERLRIAVAANHLLAGATVADLAERMGYSDPTAFTRAFRRIHGSSPTQWRAQQRARMG